MSPHSFPVEDALRKRWHDPAKTLKAAGLTEGMTFIDLGCGEGFFAIPAAQIVGEKGRVYAVDINADAVERLKRTAAEKGFKNLTATAGAAEETVFCEQCADFVFFGTVLHDFKDPARVLRNAKRMIKPAGVLVDLDWKRKFMPLGPPMAIRFSEEHASNLLTQTGFRVENVKDQGRYFYIIMAKP
jgi:ubiquinone/menaquinone biosynthesis C-methylase UbiE